MTTRSTRIGLAGRLLDKMVTAATPRTLVRSVRDRWASERESSEDWKTV
jgi:hypothetical protein